MKMMLKSDSFWGCWGKYGVTFWNRSSAGVGSNSGLSPLTLNIWQKLCFPGEVHSFVMHRLVQMHCATKQVDLLCLRLYHVHINQCEYCYLSSDENESQLRCNSHQT